MFRALKLAKSWHGMAGVSVKRKKLKLHISKSPQLTRCEPEESCFGAHRESAKGKCIHELFREQAERTPDAVAVVYQGRELSYRQLDNRSNQVAQFLRKLGVECEALVAICLERSPGMVVGLLGILKAGGAYVPLDPSYPPERLAFMLEDTQAQVLLTNRSLHPMLRKTSAKTVYLEPDLRDIDHHSTVAPTNLVTPANLAYVIYTSGSTGKPKGVLVEHAGMVNLVFQHRELYGTREGIRISQTANASFDSMGSEIWPALLSGATLCIASNEVRTDPELLQRWLIDQRITVAFATTVIAERLLALSWPEEEIALLVLRFGGEWFRGRPGNRRYPFKVYNEYGPTEDTVWTTVAEVVDENASGTNIGRPITNHRIYVLDKNRKPVPVGETGELCIGGVGLARGYLNRPELTAEKFIANPFGEDKTERLYRTGDLVRCLADGSLEFLGRIDSQVKIRGYRIEPGEIEVVLSRHSSVQECVVTVRETPLGDKQIVAYVVAHGSLNEDATEGLAHPEMAEEQQALPANRNELLAPKLRNYLLSKLPDHMVPSAYVFLHKLPLTPNGKLDRRVLPEPRPSRSRFVEPQTPLQRELAKIWQNVLAVERVGLEDDFFELGGHSLLAISMVSEIRRILGKRLPLATLLEAATIEKLAATLQAQDWKLTWSPLVAIQPHGSRPPFFAVHGLSGEVMFYRELAQHLGQDQPLYGIQSEGSDGGSIRYRSMETIARYYIDEIRRVQPCGPYYLGGYCIGGLVAFEMARQLRVAEEQVACLVLLEPDPPPYRGTLRKRMQLVLDETAVLPSSEKLRYFTGRIAQKVKWKIGKLQAAGSDLIESLYNTVNKSSEINADRLEPIRSPVGMMLARARKRYIPRAYPGRITLFLVPVSEYGQLAHDRGWSAFAEGGVEIHEIPGEHLTIFESQYASVFAEKLLKLFSGSAGATTKTSRQDATPGDRDAS
jgi:amino acid adenylation domain-containing protein